MNPLIKEQLDKLNIPKPEYNDDTTELTFNKIRSIADAPVKKADDDLPFYFGSDLELKVGGIYVIKVASYITNPPPNFDLTQKWNRNILIIDTYLLAEINQINGKMIKFTGKGYVNETKQANNNFYNGLWLPQKSITVIERME